MESQQSRLLARTGWTWTGGKHSPTLNLCMCDWALSRPPATPWFLGLSQSTNRRPRLYSIWCIYFLLLEEHYRTYRSQSKRKTSLPFCFHHPVPRRDVFIIWNSSHCLCAAISWHVTMVTYRCHGNTAGLHPPSNQLSAAHICHQSRYPQRSEKKVS